jgi:hypothetical protein
MSIIVVAVRNDHSETHEAQVRAITACRFVLRPALEDVVGSDGASSPPSDGTIAHHYLLLTSQLSKDGNIVKRFPVEGNFGSPKLVRASNDR